jgi:homoserine dehydrogenase
VADIIDTALGRAQLTFKTLRLWTDSDKPLPMAPPEQVHGRYYLRFQAEDRPGVLAQIARVVGEHGISIASVIQHEAVEEPKGAQVPLIIMTHNATEANMKRAIREIDQFACVKPPSVCMRVEG